VLLFVVLATTAVGCQTYFAPPSASIDGLDSGTLGDPSAPLVIRFRRP